MIFKDYLTWSMPPIIGAVIGYVTNDIAIKMLFRPLAEKRVFGLRLPFTPGILPRQRHKLADNIGRMVERELITESILRAKLSSTEFREAFRLAVGDYSERLLSSPIRALLPEPAAGPTGAPGLDSLAAGLIDRLSSSPALAEWVNEAVAAGLRGLAGHRIDELLGADAAESGRRIAAALGRILDRATEPDRLAAIGSDLADRFLAVDRPLAEWLGLDAAAALDHAIEPLYPRLVEAVLGFLRRDEIRADLESRGRVFLRDAFLRLNLFQRLFASAAQYDRTLAERMPAIIDDLIKRIGETAAEPSNRRRVLAALKSAGTGMLGRTPDQLAAEFGWDRAKLSAGLAEWLGRLLAAPELRCELGRRISGIAADALSLPVGELLSDRLGIDLDDVIGHVQGFVRRWLSGLDGASAAGSLRAWLNDQGGRTLGQLFALDVPAKTELDRAAATWILALAEDQVAAILRTLDVRRLVADRIDTLDMESVERIVLDVLADQLKWINVFGAVLGALIGLAQVAISAFL